MVTLLSLIDFGILGSGLETILKSIILYWFCINVNLFWLEIIFSQFIDNGTMQHAFCLCTEVIHFLQLYIFNNHKYLSND